MQLLHKHAGTFSFVQVSIFVGKMIFHHNPQFWLTNKNTTTGKHFLQQQNKLNPKD
jgi:hypothetical protein